MNGNAIPKGLEWVKYYKPEIQQVVQHPLIINQKDTSLLVWIPPGEFEMGDGKDNDCPRHRVHLDGYYIGVYCVTNRQYKVFVDETGHRPPDKTDYGTPIWKGKSYPTEYADHPVVCVSWEDATAYCAWAGLQLPTEAQWENSARGPSGFIYPWGSAWDETRCRSHKNKATQTTCRVYDYPEGISGYGTYNQSGNVWEWCQDWYGPDHYNTSPRENPAGPSTGSYRVCRGGSWNCVIADGFRAADRYNRDPAIRYDYFGFRACLPPGQRQSGQVRQQKARVWPWQGRR
jgi:formylglycine-generating enzyme required for sulfatase activity